MTLNHVIQSIQNSPEVIALFSRLFNFPAEYVRSHLLHSPLIQEPTHNSRGEPTVNAFYPSDDTNPLPQHQVLNPDAAFDSYFADARLKHLNAMKEFPKVGITDNASAGDVLNVPEPDWKYWSENSSDLRT